MREKIASAAVVLVALMLVSASTAAAASLTYSKGSGTDTAFNNATTLKGWEVSGTGSDATLDYALSDTTTQYDAPGMSGSSSSVTKGMVIEPTAGTVSTVTATLSSASDATQAELVRVSDGTVLASTSIPNDGVVTFDGLSLSVGTQYRISAGAGGSSYTYASASENFPVSRPGFDVVTGSSGGGTGIDVAYQWDTLDVTYEDYSTSRYVSRTYNIGAQREHTVDIPSLSDADVRVTIQATDGSGGWQNVTSSTYSSGGRKKQTLGSGTPAGVESYRTVIEAVPTGSAPSASVDTEFYKYRPSPPDVSLSSPSEGAGASERDVELVADVSDAGFSFAEGDTVTAEFYVDGELVGSDTVTTNGTASHTYTTSSGGSHDWYVEVTDSHGDTATSATRSFNVPATLYVRPVTNATELVNESVTVTGRFYSGDLVFERSTTDGKIDLTGLDPGREYVLTVNADGYHRRTLIIESLYEQSDAYLLSKNKSSVYNSFVVDDLTGDFSGEGTRLYIERAVDDGGGLEWKVAAGDYLGAAGTFKVDLQKDERYRLIIENGDGDRRELGAYTAAEEGIVALEVGRVVWDVEEAEGIVWDARTYNLSESNPDPFGYVHFRYNDPNQTTTRLDVVIHEQGNVSNELYNNTVTGEYGTYTLNQTISGEQVTDKTWLVEYTAYTANDTISASRPVAAQKKYPVENPFGDKWGPAIIGGVLLFTGLIFGGIHSNFGAVAVGGVAAVLWYLGWYEASAGVVLLAIATGALYIVGNGSGPRR
jgi:hypothetical protein